jgi:hypothetical protein
MCDICEDTGRYPVIDRFGRELYTISCPECGGYPKSEPNLPPSTVYERDAEPIYVRIE